jgi:hypothetical protein
MVTCGPIDMCVFSTYTNGWMNYTEQNPSRSPKMPSIPIPKIEVATELLQSSLHHFYSDPPQYFSAICLAGAAEELFGKHVEAHGGVTAFASLREGAMRIFSSLFKVDIRPEGVAKKEIGDLMNSAKNSTKHMGALGDDLIHFNPRVEAHSLIQRATSNFYQASEHFELTETDLMRRFSSEQISGVSAI